MANKWKKVAAVAVSLAMASSMAVGMTACGPKDPVGKGQYTYKDFFTTSPKTWNPHQWESSTDSMFLDAITMGFYDTDLAYDTTTGKANGYKWVNEMASKAPQDVTSEYTGQYDVAAGDQGKAWRVYLNDKACWEDGTAIKAEDYIYSMQQLLDPDMLNRRSDSYTSGEFTIVGAEYYLYSKDETIYTKIGEKYDTLQAAVDGMGDKVLLPMWAFYGLEGAPKYINSTESETWGEWDITLEEDVTCPEYVAYNDEVKWFDIGAYYQYLDLYEYYSENLEFFLGKLEESGLDEETKAKYEANVATCQKNIAGIETTYPDAAAFAVSANDLYGTYKAYFEVDGDYEAVFAENNEHFGFTWDKPASGINGGVGLLKGKDTEGEYLDIIIETEIDLFTAYYNLSGNWLVHKALYEEHKKTVEGLVESTYNTSVASTLSYGPYKLTKYVPNQYIILERNNKWYGYSDGNHEGQYQTTKIDLTYMASATAKQNSFQSFMNGDLITYGVNGTELDTYGNSMFYKTNPTSYTYQFFLATDKNELLKRDDKDEKVNHSALSNASFRKAISFAISRTEYCNTYSPASEPGFGILNKLYVSNHDTDGKYRDSDAAKRTSLLYSGYTEGENGKWTDSKNREYADLEAAYASITGQDVDYAKKLFQEAFTALSADTEINMNFADVDVVIDFGSVGAASATTNAMIQMFNEQIAAALPENTFKSVKIVVDPSYASEAVFWEAVQTGHMDLAFAGWGGDTYGPWNTIYNCYVNQANSLNYNFDKIAKTVNVTYTVNDTEYTNSLYDVSTWMANNQKDRNYTSSSNNLYTRFGRFSALTLSEQEAILAAAELAQLNTCANIPVSYGGSSYLLSAKYQFGADYYINSLVGQGAGYRNLQYNYDDAEWDAFVNKNKTNGTLENFYKTF